MSIKEANLPKQTAPGSSSLAQMFFRIVTAQITGLSKIIKGEDLSFTIDNIDGLQEFLDGLQGLSGNPSTDLDYLMSYSSTGGNKNSTFKTGSFSRYGDVDLLITRGLYYAAGTGVTYQHPIMGNIYFVIVSNNTQLLFTSQGVWFRTYSTEWSVPRYVGGSFSNITGSYNEINTLKTNSHLTPGTVYSIVDFATTGYNNILLQAASSSEFYNDGLAFLPVPIHRAPGLFTIGGSNITSIGCWNSGSSVAVDNICWYYGKMFKNITGSIGTVNGFGLDSTNWLYLSPSIYPEYYTVVLHNVIYDFDNNFIKQETDESGNTYGDIIKSGDNFETRYNDWYWNIDGGNFYGNKLLRCYNNTNFLEDSSAIINNSGNGTIKNCTSEDFTMMNNDFGKKDNFTSPFLTIYNTTGAVIINNSITGAINDRIDELIGNVIKGSLSGNYDTSIDNSIINEDCNISNKHFGGYSIKNSNLITADTSSETFIANKYIKEDIGEIMAQVSVGASQVSIPNNSISVPTFIEGAFATDFNNGLTVSGASFTIKYPGLYRIVASGSALCENTPNPLKLYVYKNGVATGIVSSITYPAVDSWIARNVTGFLNLSAGDIITFRYWQSTGNAITINIDYLTYILVYEGKYLN